MSNRSLRVFGSICGHDLLVCLYPLSASRDQLLHKCAVGVFSDGASSCAYVSIASHSVFIASFVFQVLVCSVSVGAAYFMLGNATLAKLAGGDHVGATAAPLLIVGCISFLVAGTTMSSLSSATAALMHCLVADEDISKALSLVDLEGMNAVTHAPMKLRQFIQNIG